MVSTKDILLAISPREVQGLTRMPKQPTSENLAEQYDWGAYVRSFRSVVEGIFTMKTTELELRSKLFPI